MEFVLVNLIFKASNVMNVSKDTQERIVMNVKQAFIKLSISVKFVGVQSPNLMVHVINQDNVTAFPISLV